MKSIDLSQGGFQEVYLSAIRQVVETVFDTDDEINGEEYMNEEDRQEFTEYVGHLFGMHLTFMENILIGMAKPEDDEWKDAVRA